MSEQIQANRKKALDTLCIPDMEQWHTKSVFFDPMHDAEQKPTLGNCEVCALGLVALSLGFDKFTLVKAGEHSPMFGQPTQDTWFYRDVDVIRFLEEAVGIEPESDMATLAIERNDEEDASLCEIASFLGQAWSEEDVTD